jgi:hypothetical protein
MAATRHKLDAHSQRFLDTGHDMLVRAYPAKNGNGYMMHLDVMQEPGPDAVPRTSINAENGRPVSVWMPTRAMSNMLGRAIVGGGTVAVDTNRAVYAAVHGRLRQGENGVLVPDESTLTAVGGKTPEQLLGCDLKDMEQVKARFKEIAATSVKAAEQARAETRRQARTPGVKKAAAPGVQKATSPKTLPESSRYVPQPIDQIVQPGQGTTLPTYVPPSDPPRPWEGQPPIVGPYPGPGPDNPGRPWWEPRPPIVETYPGPHYHGPEMTELVDPLPEPDGPSVFTDKPYEPVHGTVSTPVQPARPQKTPSVVLSLELMPEGEWCAHQAPGSNVIDISKWQGGVALDRENGTIATSKGFDYASADRYQIHGDLSQAVPFVGGHGGTLGGESVAFFHSTGKGSISMPLNAAGHEDNTTGKWLAKRSDEDNMGRLMGAYRRSMGVLEAKSRMVAAGVTPVEASTAERPRRLADPGVLPDDGSGREASADIDY